MDSAARVEASMARARRARAEGDLDGVEDALADADLHAARLDQDHPLRAATVWRRLKSAFDRDDLDALGDRLSEAASLVGPFDHYPKAIAALEPVSRRWWDARGYGHPAMPVLWTAWSQAWRAAGDPWMAACGETQLAWEWACQGDLRALRGLVERAGALGPADFARSPSKHPLADDAATSVWFACMDHAQVALRGAVWGGDAELAHLGAELYADARAEAGLDAGDWWFLEAVGRAEIAFGWRPELAPEWARAQLVHPRAALHLALRDAIVDPGPATAQVLVERLPTADAAGPEWGIDARLVAAAALDDSREPLRQQARERMERFGVRVFGRPGGPLG